MRLSILVSLPMILSGTAEAKLKVGINYPINPAANQTGVTPPKIDSGTFKSTTLSKMLTEAGASVASPFYKPENVRLVSSFKRLSLGGNKFELSIKSFDVAASKGNGSPQKHEDYSQVLKDKPIVIMDNGKGDRVVENFDELISSLLKAIPGKSAKNIFHVLFDEKFFSTFADFLSRDADCLADLGGKQVKATWQAIGNINGKKHPINCEFVGWANSGTQKIAIVQFTVSSQKFETKLPMGLLAWTASGRGKIYLDTSSSESIEVREFTIFSDYPAPGMPRLKIPATSTLHIIPSAAPGTTKPAK